VQYGEAESFAGSEAFGVIDDPSASGGACILLAGSSKGKFAEYRFEVPKPGKYFVLLRVRSAAPVGSHNSLYFAVDRGPLDRSQVRSAPSWTWSMAAHNRKQSLSCLQAFDLDAGEHELKLAPRESIYVDLAAVTDNPALFE
jgi:hypothetical protein